MFFRRADALTVIADIKVANQARVPVPDDWRKPTIITKCPPMNHHGFIFFFACLLNYLAIVSFL